MIDGALSQNNNFKLDLATGIYPNRPVSHKRNRQVAAAKTFAATPTAALWQNTTFDPSPNRNWQSDNRGVVMNRRWVLSACSGAHRCPFADSKRNTFESVTYSSFGPDHSSLFLSRLQQIEGYFYVTSHVRSATERRKDGRRSIPKRTIVAGNLLESFNGREEMDECERLERIEPVRRFSTILEAYISLTRTRECENDKVNRI